jgi:hypothetical protein
VGLVFCLVENRHFVSQQQSQKQLWQLFQPDFCCRLLSYSLIFAVIRGKLMLALLSLPLTSLLLQELFFWVFWQERPGTTVGAKV